MPDVNVRRPGTGSPSQGRVVLEILKLGFPWPVVDLFIVAVHHVGDYPASNIRTASRPPCTQSEEARRSLRFSIHGMARGGNHDVSATSQPFQPPRFEHRLGI